MRLGWLRVLGCRPGSVVSRATIVEGSSTTAAGARGCLEGILEWTFGGVRGFRSAAVAMAPIKVTAGPARPDFFCLPDSTYFRTPLRPACLGENHRLYYLPAAIEPPPAVRSPCLLHQDPGGCNDVASFRGLVPHLL